MNLTAKLMQGEIMSSSLLDQQLYLDRSTPREGRLTYS